jgi:hypothetical protein
MLCLLEERVWSELLSVFEFIEKRWRARGVSRGGLLSVTSFSKPGRNALKKAFRTKLTTVCHILVRCCSRRHHKTRKFLRSGQNCPDSKTRRVYSYMYAFFHLTEEALMVSMPKAVGVMSCGFLLCPGLFNAAQADNAASANDEMKADQSDRMVRK